MARVMSKSLRLTRKPLGGVALLLAAGACPVLGAEGVYRCGEMLLAAGGCALLALWAGPHLPWARCSLRRLWLAGLHLSLVLLLVGVGLDAAGELRCPFLLPADGRSELSSVLRPDNRREPLGMSLCLESFEVQRYASAGAPVKDYRARCRVTPEGAAPFTAELTVNRPLDCAGWRISLLDYRRYRGQTLVRLQARRSPGRLVVRAGLVGTMLFSCLWCWWPKRKEVAPC